MSASTNPDRIYVTREYRATVRLDQDDPLHPKPFMPDVSLPGMGAILMNISAGGCCLRLPRFEIPSSIRPGCQLSSIKLLHPTLDNSPIKGRIAWSREDPPYVLIGVQFMHIQSATQESIRSYINACRSRTA